MMISKKNKILKQKKMKIDGDDDAQLPPYLPQELIIDNILTRIPGRILARWSCVCKLWYTSTYNDRRFADAHLIRNQSKIKLFICLLNVKFSDRVKTTFYTLDDDCQHRFLTNVVAPDTSEFVGCFDGLACITKVYSDAYDGIRGMIVINPTRREILYLPYLHPRTEMGCKYLFHGFGFDSSTQEYKVVVVFTSRANDEFISLVLTLGTKTWRKIVTSVADISPPPHFPKRMVTRASGNIRTPATLCGGDLFWRMVVENEEVNNNKSHMLLSFDIHNEKIRFIRLPAECNSTPTLTTTSVVEHHLLEHKGYLCIAQSEKATRNNIDESRQDSFVCHCSFTVQLYILKDKVKQLWVKGETFGVQVQQLGLAPAPFCCYFDATTAAPTTIPTRIMSFSGQVLLYWFDGECLKFYNLKTERLEVVKSSCSSNWISRLNFEAKMKGFPPERGVGGYMEYQLHTQVENIRCLKTFIPAGEIIKFDDSEDFQRFYESNKNKAPAGWVIATRETVKLHAFY